MLFYVQYIVESARQRPARRRVSSSVRKSLYQRLYELYMEECEKEPELKVTLVLKPFNLMKTTTIRSFKSVQFLGLVLHYTITMQGWKICYMSKSLWTLGTHTYFLNILIHM